MVINYNKLREEGDGFSSCKLLYSDSFFSRAPYSSYLPYYFVLMSCFRCLLKIADGMAGCFERLLRRVLRNTSNGLQLSISAHIF